MKWARKNSQSSVSLKNLISFRLFSCCHLHQILAQSGDCLSIYLHHTVRCKKIRCSRIQYSYCTRWGQKKPDIRHFTAKVAMLAVLGNHNIDVEQIFKNSNGIGNSLDFWTLWFDHFLNFFTPEVKANLPDPRPLQWIFFMGAPYKISGTSRVQVHYSQYQFVPKDLECSRFEKLKI
jgi:hypothetical protein